MRINCHGKIVTLAILTSVMIAGCGGKESNGDTSGDAAAETAAGPAAPLAKVENVMDTHWGVKVDDPYRYMEDQDDPEVVEWFKGQAKYTASVLESLPMREKLYERLVELDQGAPFETYGVRRLASGDMFYMRRNADENLGKLYYHPAESDAARLLVDPESLGAEGEQHYSLEAYMPSWSGRSGSSRTRRLTPPSSRSARGAITPALSVRSRSCGACTVPSP